MKKKTKDLYLNNCTFIKTILMLLVVIYHSSVFWTGTWLDTIKVSQQSVFLSLFSKWLNSFHIYTFTLVSGYIFNSLSEKGKYKDFHLFLYKKIKRLIVPYWFVALVWVAPISFLFFSMDTREIFYKYVFCINPSQLWFLWMLFDIFIISWFLREYIKRDIFAVILCISSYILSFIGSKLVVNIFCIWSALRFLTFFIIGMKISEKVDKILNRIPILLYIIAHTIFFMIVNLISNNDGVIYSLLQFVFTYLMNIAGSLMAFYVLRYFSTKFDWQNFKLLNKFSNRAMVIYLFHQQIIYFTIILLNGKISPILNMIINFIVAIIISYIISDMLLKFRITRILVGEK